MPTAGGPAPTAAHRSVISALNPLVGARGRAIVWGGSAGGGGTAITPGAGRGLPDGGRAASRDGRAGLAAFRELAGCAVVLPPGPAVHPVTSTAATAAVSAHGRRPRRQLPGRDSRGRQAGRLGVTVTLVSSADRQAQSRLS